MGPHGSLVSTEIPTEGGTEKLDGPPCGHSMGNVTPWTIIGYDTELEYRIHFLSRPPCDFFRLLRNVNGWRSVFNDPDFLSRCEFMRIDILKVVFWNRAYIRIYFARGEGCGRFALRWKIYARRNIEENFQIWMGNRVWKQHRAEEGNIVTDDGRLIELLGKICFQFQSPRIDENDREGKQERRWITGGSGDFLEAGRVHLFRWEKWFLAFWDFCIH